MPTFQRRPVPEIGADQAGELANAVLLDVREPKEWAAGHAPEAAWIPLGELEARRFELPINLRIAVICRSGHRSATATTALTEWGFDAVNVAGGMLAWMRAGRAVVTDDGSPGTVT